MTSNPPATEGQSACPFGILAPALKNWTGFGPQSSCKDSFPLYCSYNSCIFNMDRHARILSSFMRIRQMSLREHIHMSFLEI